MISLNFYRRQPRDTKPREWSRRQRVVWSGSGSLTNRTWRRRAKSCLRFRYHLSEKIQAIDTVRVDIVLTQISPVVHLLLMELLILSMEYRRAPKLPLMLSPRKSKQRAPWTRRASRLR